jgi:hypothetical protein
MQVSVGNKNNVGKALSLRHGYSLTKVNNAAYIVFRPIEEALEQHHFFVSAFYKGTTIITKHCLELISLKHSEIRILIGDGYVYFNLSRFV